MYKHAKNHIKKNVNVKVSTNPPPPKKTQAKSMWLWGKKQHYGSLFQQTFA